MDSIKELWPDRWLKAEHLNGKAHVVTVAGAVIEVLYNPTKRREEPKLIVSFQGKALRLICNKTQAHALARLAGTPVFAQWPGTAVLLTVGQAPNGRPTIVINPAPTRAVDVATGEIQEAATQQ